MSGEPLVALVLTLPPRLEAPAAARAALSSMEPFVGGPCVEVAQLLVSELVTNSLRHANVQPEHRIETRAHVLQDALYIEVSDDGPGFDAPPPRRTPIAEESGVGLVLLDRLARRWGVIRDGRTRVWGEVDY